MVQVMVVKTRARAILFPILFYLVLGTASGYLVWGASKGDRGLRAKAEYHAEAIQLQAELAQLQAERARWSRRVGAMRSEAVDRDLLDEEARAVLDRVGKDDVLIFTADAKPH
jgi:cell division protein FtsB